MQPVADFDDGLKRLVLECREFAAGADSSARLLVAIAGGSRSGKSFLAEKLREKLSAQNISAAIVPLDNYFRDRDDPALPRTESGRLVLDSPDSYHRQEFKDDVLALLHGEERRIPQYAGKPCKRLPERLTVLSGKVVIAEGLFAIRFLCRMRNCQMIKVYMEAAEEVRLVRRIAYDTVAYGTTKEKVEAVFRGIVLPWHERCVEPQRNLADIIVSTG